MAVYPYRIDIPALERLPVDAGDQVVCDAELGRGKPSRNLRMGGNFKGRVYAKGYLCGFSGVPCDLVELVQFVQRIDRDRDIVRYGKGEVFPALRASIEEEPLRWNSGPYPEQEFTGREDIRPGPECSKCTQDCKVSVCLGSIEDPDVRISLLQCFAVLPEFFDYPCLVGHV